MTATWPEIKVQGEQDITDNTDYDSFYAAKKPILRALYTVVQQPEGGRNGALIFGSETKYIGGKNSSYADVVEVANNLANNPSKRTRGILNSPFDFNVIKQCWVVIELDHEVNWQFAQGVRACKSKTYDENDGTELTGHNLLLRHVYGDGQAYEKTIVGKIGADGCRVLFFGVAHRGGLNQGTNPHHQFNLKVEFFQQGPNGILVLPTVIDPDVGNEGNDQIP